MTERRAAIDVRGEAGFTLTELLVAIIIGVVIVLAAFGLLDNTISVGTKVTKRVDATQRGRVAMDMIMRDLHSQVCLPGGTPQASLRGASDTSVDFYADLGDGSAAKPPQRRTIIFDPAQRTLVEQVYTPTGAAGSYAFSGTPSATRTLLKDVVQDGTTPIFRYYPVDATPDDATAPAALNATSGLAAADLDDVARIVIDFKALPSRAATTTSTAVLFQDEVYRRAVDPNATDPSPECW
jgi:prepilin-type N-terminal cleavage/methylation domain-containing protein